MTEGHSDGAGSASGGGERPSDVLASPYQFEKGKGKMEDADSHQVGGTFYKTDYQHWNLILDVGRGTDYLSATATKYVTRWRKKNGLEDLRKALHYIDKMVENIDRLRFARGSFSEAHFARYVEANQLNEREAHVVRLLTNLSYKTDLLAARDIVRHMLFDATKPVRTDSNKHAVEE